MTTTRSHAPPKCHSRMSVRDRARSSRPANFVRGALHLPSSRPLTHSLLHAPEARQRLTELVHSHQPDLVSHTARAWRACARAAPRQVPARRRLRRHRFREVAESEQARSPPRRWVFKREARTLAKFEALAAERAKAVFVVNERERDALRALAPPARVNVVANGIDVAAFAEPGAASESPVVAFCGVMDYQPNVDAVTWFGRSRLDPRPSRTSVGAISSLSARILQSPSWPSAPESESIEITGRIDSVQPHLWRAARLGGAPARRARRSEQGVGIARRGAAHGHHADGPHRPSCGRGRWLRRRGGSGRVLEGGGGMLRQPAPPGGPRRLDRRVDRLAWPAQLAGLEAILQEAAGSPRSAPMHVPSIPPPRLAWTCRPNARRNVSAALRPSRLDERASLRMRHARRAGVSLQTLRRIEPFHRRLRDMIFEPPLGWWQTAVQRLTF